MKCVKIPSKSYTEFGSRLHEQIGNRRIPLSGSIEVTARCNLSCAHCYISTPATDNRARTHELTFGEFCDLIDQITDEGCLWLLFTGGEPFIRGDFLDIYSHAKKRGLLITLFTNGTFITPGIADYLSEWKPLSIEITLYGRTQETYEKVTGIKGSYDRCMRGIRLLIEKNLPVKLKTMVLSMNKHEVWEMKAYVRSLGVGFHFDPLINLGINGNTKPGAVRIQPDEVVSLDLADVERMKDWEEFCEKFLISPPQPDYLYQCGAGIRSFHIDAYGQLSSCMMARLPAYNLRLGSFSDGWHTFMQDVIAQQWSHDIPCKTCSLLSLCGRCPGWAQLEHGDQEKTVSYLCKIAHLRAEAFGLKQAAYSRET